MVLQYISSKEIIFNGQLQYMNMNKITQWYNITCSSYLSNVLDAFCTVKFQSVG